MQRSGIISEAEGMITWNWICFFHAICDKLLHVFYQVKEILKFRIYWDSKPIYVVGQINSFFCQPFKET